MLASRRCLARRARKKPATIGQKKLAIAPTIAAMAQALAHVDVRQPAVPLIANVLAAPISDPAEIKQCLVQQVTGTVRWRECVGAMAAGGVTDIYEIGSGKVLAGLAKRIVPSLNATAVGTPQDIEAALSALSR